MLKIINLIGMEQEFNLYAGKQQNNKVMMLLILLFLHITQITSFLSSPPVWLTSSYFRAGNEAVISRLTGNNETPTYNFVFSSALPGVPSLAYGVKGYMGNDYFGVQEFEIRRVNLTASSFTVAVQIKGTTNIHLLNVPYIAIDPTFPHHLNSFDGVPVNYSAGNLTNLTAKSTTQVLSYTNTINYTQQAASRVYKTFSNPLSNNKILLYLMALSIAATNQGSGATWYPIDLRINSQVLSNQTYQLSVTLSNNTCIYYIILSQIIFDVADVQSSNRYFIVQERIDYPNSGGFYQLPQEFVDNFIMGLIDFSTPRGQSVLAYNWIFKTVNGKFGVFVNYSLPYQSTRLGPSALSRMGTMIFYMKTWQCPTGYDYFNLTSNLCQDMCGDYHFQQNALYTCQYCSYSCLDCTSGFDCLLCNAADYRYLSNQKTCQCMTGYYDDTVSTVCKPCNARIAHCNDCFYNSTYRAADASTGALQYGCFGCQYGYFLQNNQCIQLTSCPAGQGANANTNICQSCSTGCLACTLSNNCTTCNSAANYFLNTETRQCALCSIPGCSSCTSSTQCQSCAPGFILANRVCKCPDGQYYNSYSGTCMVCSQFCLTCDGPSAYQCKSCNSTLKRLLVGGQCQCDPYNYKQSSTGTLCQKIDPNKCQRGYIKLITTGQCVQICGDGWKIQYECDDGNVINTDGCSDQCKIQKDFTCHSQVSGTSVCKLQTQVQFNSVQIKKDQLSNTLYFTIDISPDSVVYDNYDLTQLLHFRGGLLDVQDAYYQDGKLYIKANYSRNLQGKSIQLQIKQNYAFNPMYPDNYQDVYNTTKATFSLSSVMIPLVTTNNLQVNAYTEEQYARAEGNKKASTAILAIGLIAAFGCLAIKNSLATMVNINAMQISYLALVSITGMQPSTAAMLIIKPILGFNNPNLFEEQKNNVPSTRVESIGFVQSFANNFNIMFFIQVALLASSALLHLAAYKKPMIKLASSFLQREAFLFITFNSSTVFFSVTLMSEPTVLNIAFAATSTSLVLYQVVHLILNGKNYFGFKQVFDLTPKGHFKKFVIVYFLCRLGTCLSLSYINVEPLKSLVSAAAFEGAFILFISFFRPFYHSFNNFFMILGEIFAISFFGSVYSSEALTIKEREESASVMIYLIGAIAVTAIANLIYSTILDLKEAGKKLKSFNELIEAKQNAKPVVQL